MDDGRFTFVSDKEVEMKGEQSSFKHKKTQIVEYCNVYKRWARARNHEFRDFRPENAESSNRPS